ncbi:MAG: hypothetical protein LBL82_08425 [Oscillospiraceae bacterium]|nr:hypothetical protein [Oscillospiraceae bacterium]
MFCGSSINTVDSKGRIFIPARFKMELGEKFILMNSPFGCLRIYTEEEWARCAKKLDKAASKDASKRNAVRNIYRTIESVTPDSQGRIVIPEAHRTNSDITDKVEIIGMNSYIELWSPDKYEQDVAISDKETLKNQAVELGF